ncbi:MAG TPA: isoprenylcysteine carboxylmethyltransferase family protein [Gemmatimonadales bacterium]|nr:isoprenylcysteine carboxylmethyltransferase family protein [Gemmatimonadales bacterium]
MPPDAGILSIVGQFGVLAGWFGFAAGVLLRRRGPVAGDRARDRGSLAGILIQAAGFAVVWGLRRPQGTPIFSMSPVTWLLLTGFAIALALGSAWLGAAAIRTLGKQWSLQARITQDHDLITTGPYRFVRHPIYAAMLGLLLGTGLAFSRPVGLGAGLLTFLVGTALRVRVEERLLRATFGETYDAYARQVPAVVPRVLMFPRKLD